MFTELANTNTTHIMMTFCWILLMLFPSHSGAFIISGTGGPHHSKRCCRMIAKPSFLHQGMHDNHDTNRQRQELLIEEIALMGAEDIANLSISERAKRALLAEAIEDRIFRLTEELEVMVGADGSVDERNKEAAMETARTVKELQQQYAELVTGGPSSVLTALDSLGDSLKSD
jgi:hypothetical protein